MDKENNAIKTDASTVATKEGTQVVVPTEIDYEARNTALEAEKAKLIEENANYKLAFLKEKKKNSSQDTEEVEEDEESMIRRITKETLANSRLAEIAREQAEIIQKALKENKELKLAQLSRTGGVPSSIGSHTETKVVQDTLVTQDQIEAFKKRGWTEKDIERYKKNLQKNTR